MQIAAPYHSGYPYSIEPPAPLYFVHRLSDLASYNSSDHKDILQNLILAEKCSSVKIGEIADTDVGNICRPSYTFQFRNILPAASLFHNSALLLFCRRGPCLRSDFVFQIT